MAPPSDWSQDEQSMWKAVREGQPLTFGGAGDQDDDEAGPTGVVRASVLTTLLLNPPATEAHAVRKLHIAGARITGPVQLAHAKISLAVTLVDCHFDEPIDLTHAEARSLDLHSSHFPSLAADGIRVAGDLALAEVQSGEISLFGAVVEGNVWLGHARLSAGSASSAVNAPQIRIRGGLYANDLHAVGRVNLWAAEAFSIELRDTNIECIDDVALRCDGLKVTQDVSCINASIVGDVSLFGARIGGQLWLGGTTVRGGDSHHEAINAPSMKVDGGLYARELVADGGLGLFASTIGESVELHGSRLTSANGHALRATGLRVERDLTFDSAAEITGRFDLSDATVNGTFETGGMKFDADTALDLHGTTIGALDLSRLGDQPARLNLRAATITELRDSGDRWPHQLDLNGLTYGSLDPVLPPNRRLAWLRRDSGSYRPQPYEQLAAYYRRIGHDDAARTVLLARHRHRRSARRLPARLWEYIEDLAVGYGYRPGRALAWLCGFTALVALAFSAEPPRALRSDGPDFQPVAYALDLILPILDLGQERAFTPVGPTRWVAWAAIVTGWLLATTVIAGITRRVNRA